MKSRMKRVRTFIWAKKWRALGVLLLLGAVSFFLIKKFFLTKPDTSFVSNDYTVMTGEVANSLSLA